MPINASRLDRRVLLSHRVVMVSANGQRSYTFVPYVEVWAMKIEAGGREYQAGQTLIGEATFTFRIRWRKDVKSTDQVTFEGAIFNIGTISEIGRREGLDLLASGVVC
jgi:SPP1 family predicted phage head-tail adaptor